MALPAPPLPRTISLSETMSIPRLVVGMWQLSSEAWNSRPPNQTIINDMRRYYKSGLFAFDFADHYGPAEVLYGDFLDSLKSNPIDDDDGDDAAAAADNLPAPVGWTKYCPQPSPQTDDVVQASLQRSLDRIRVPILDCVQFHWWDYSDRRYLDALGAMARFRDAGRYLRHIALTNFDSTRVDEICNVIGGVLANQVQFSVVDTRPEGRMREVCDRWGVRLLAYGTFCGGFLSDAWLGLPEPNPRIMRLSPSQRKYLSTIRFWSSWADFQDLLAVLRSVADKHKVSIANVATRYVLQQPHVAAVIVGARLGVSAHLEDNDRVFGFTLDEEDFAAIKLVQGRGNDLTEVIGDCGDEYRNR